MIITIKKKKSPIIFKKFLKFLIGFVIFLIILSFWTGGIAMAIQFVVIISICTAGIGAVVISFISYFIGSITLAIFNKFNSSGSSTIKSKASGVDFLKRERNISVATHDYIKKAKSLGVSSETIKENLVKAGWSEKDINKFLSNSNRT